MRKLFYLLAAAFILTGCATSNDETSKLENAKMSKWENGLTDYHAHAIPDSYRELVAKHGKALDEGFPLPQWSVEAHRQMMEEAGIDRAILTLPAPHPYFGDQAECTAACRQFNEELANLVESQKSKVESGLIVRIAKIEVNEGYLEQYLAAAHNVGAKSVETEPGVICIFPMQVKEQPNTIRIVEIYRDQEAYQSHLQTPHFLDYKQGTLHMVKSLKLVDTNPLAPESMPLIFKKF